ncbi:MAG: polysaccharide deacetylase family protein [Clostridiales bacterium]|nr:polysaccharide deacetylase family protein [Candidatus Cacconaster stercorequi]
MAERKKKRTIGRAIRLAGCAVLLLALVIGGMSLIKGYFILSPQVHLSVQGSQKQDIDAFSKYTDEGAVAMLGKTDLSDQIKTEGSVNTKVPGSYIVTYSLDYKGKHYTQQRTVRVVDRDAPELKLKGEDTVVVSRMELFDEPGYTAKDRCDGDLTDCVTVEQQKKDATTYRVVYQVADKAGNMAEAVRTLEIRDIVPPELELRGEEHMFVPRGDRFTDPGAVATDDADGDLTEAITCTGTVDTDAVGDYTLRYSVSDSAENRAEVKRTVTVYEESADNPNRIYLTFDDGPTEKVTPHILDVLEKNHIKATFFILKYSDEDKPILQRMINAGHTVGIHGYSHDYATIYSSEKAFMNSIQTLHDQVQKDFGYDAKVIRFPGGSSNTISADYKKGIMTCLTKRVEQEGYTYFDWNVDSSDANGNNVDASTIYESTTQGLFKDGNNVVLMHDSYYKTTTADALQKIIDYGHKNGYSFLPITADTTPCHHGVAN